MGERRGGRKGEGKNINTVGAYRGHASMRQILAKYIPTLQSSLENRHLHRSHRTTFYLFLNEICSQKLLFACVN